MKKIRRFSQQMPILFSLILCVVFIFCLRGSGFLFAQLPQNTLFSFASEVFDILWPVGLTLLLGFGFIYKRKGFGATFKAGLAPIIYFLVALAMVAGKIISNPETKWQTLPVILVGVLSAIGVGLREEVIFRGIVGNLLTVKYGTTKKGLWFAIIISALLFGGLHFTNILSGAKLEGVLIQMVSASFGGLLYMAVYLRGGSIWVVTLIHAIKDAAGLFVSAFTVTTVTDVEVIGGYDFSTAIIPICIELVIVIFILRKSKLPAVFARLEELRALQNTDGKQIAEPTAEQIAE